MNDITQLLGDIESGEPRAAERLLPLVYEELRRLAASKLAREKPGQTMDATGLVHEAYLRLVPGAADAPSEPRHWAGRGHFFAAAAEAMRRILIENARRKKRIKRGGALARAPLDDVAEPFGQAHDDLLALDEALDKLAVVDPRAAQLVNLRYFAGLTIPQTAEAMQVSIRTAERIWTYARAFIHAELSDS